VLNAGNASQAFAVNWKSAYFNYNLPSQSVATLGWQEAD